MTTTPTISNVNVTNVLGSAGTPWSVATISTSTITNPATGYSANVENVVFELTQSASSAYAGAITADYLVGASGALTPVDNVFYQPNGNVTAAYYGSEAVNPYFLATGSVPANAGYAYTIYSYEAGLLSQVVAVDANGKTYTGI